MRLPALALLLLALPAAAPAAPAGSDAEGDQTAFVGSGDSMPSPFEPAGACAAPGTDVVALGAGTAAGVVTLTLVVADRPDARIACAGQAVDAVPRFVVELRGEATYGAVWLTSEGASGVLECGAHPCPALPVTLATDGNAIAWSFPVAGNGWDLAGAQVDVSAHTASYALHDPWVTTRPTLRVSDEAGPFPATL